MVAGQRATLVKQLARRVASEWNCSQFEFNRERIAVDALEIAAVQGSMDFHSRADDLIGAGVTEGNGHAEEPFKARADLVREPFARELWQIEFERRPRVANLAITSTKAPRKNCEQNREPMIKARSNLCLICV